MSVALEQEQACLEQLAASTASTDAPIIRSGDDFMDGWALSGEEDWTEDGNNFTITGKRLKLPDWGGGGGASGGTGGDGGGTPGGTLYTQCQNTSTLTPEQLEDYLVAAEAAEIAREIMQKLDRDLNEYGAVIYRDATGVITHTPLTPGNATSVPNLSLDGMTSWGQALGVVHTHPASLFNAATPNFRLHPTPGGDWVFFNSIQSLIQTSLESSGFSATHADAQANQFVQFVFGAADAAGTDNYALMRYDDGDEAYQFTGESQISHADYVNLRLGLCS